MPDAGDGDDQHHADQQCQRIEVHTGDRPAPGSAAEHDHQPGTQQRHDRAVEPVRS